MKKQRRKTDVRNALEKLGFILISGRGKHHRYIYRDIHSVKRITVNVPKGRGEMPYGTISGIRERIRLDKKQFDGAIACPFGKKEYIKIIMNKKNRSGK